MEQHIGHRTFAQNLHRYVATDMRIRGAWVPITYHQPNGMWERMSFLPANMRGTLRGRAQARNALAQAYDVAFFNTQVPAALAGDLIFSKPYVLSTDITPVQYDRIGERYGHAAERLGLLRNYKHRVNMRVFHHAACIAPWSTWAAQSLIEEYHVDPSRIQIVPPGVDMSIWKPREKKFDDGKLHILFVGGDLERKGGMDLLQAFDIFRRKMPNIPAQLDMVTRSPSPQAPDVTGYHNLQANDPRLIELYQKSDFFVLPSRAEAFGIAAIEASAVGLPLITTQVGGLSDVTSHGKTGFLIPPGDIETLVDRMVILANDSALRNQMGQAARLRALAKFDAEKNAARIVEMILKASQQ